jgi:hypothetical protein
MTTVGGRSARDKTELPKKKNKKKNAANKKLQAQKASHADPAIMARDAGKASPETRRAAF